MLKVLDTAVPIACWSCSIGHNESTLFCPHCSKIQPPPGADFFQVLGLKRAFQVDLAALEREFHRLSRTEYLLKLEGAEIGEEHSGQDRKDPSRVPADLLEEVFDLNMQLEEMRMARKMGEDDPQLQASLTGAKKKFDGLLETVDKDLRRLWRVWDDGDASVRPAAQNKMVALLDRRRYLNNLVRDVTETLGA